MTDNALCPACAVEQAAPILCDTCTAWMGAALRTIHAWRVEAATWTEIDTGTPGRDDAHALALLDSPVITSTGKPCLTVMAATDRRSKARIDSGEHDPDDVANVDAEVWALARMTHGERQWSAPMGDIFGALELLTVSLDWLCRHPAADEHLAILSDLAGRLPVDRRGQGSLGRCTSIDPMGERDRCGGALAWDETTGLNVVCTRCGWFEHRDNLAAMLPVGQPFPVPLDWLCERYALNVWTVRKWCQRGHVRRYGDGQVDLSDVLARIRDSAAEV